MCRPLLLGVALVLTGTTYGADPETQLQPPVVTLDSVKDVSQMCDEAINLLSHESIEDGLRLLEKHRLGHDEPQSKGFTDKATKALHGLRARYGKGLGYHLVRENTLADFLHRREYLCKFERHLIYFELVLYKPADRWWIYSVNLHSLPDDYLPKVFPDARP